MSSGMFEAKGILKYSLHDDVGHKLVVQVDQGIGDFYRSLIPKYYKANPQKYCADISRGAKRNPRQLRCLGEIRRLPCRFHVQQRHSSWPSLLVAKCFFQAIRRNP